ncbi:MAG: hypothetical protein KDD76_04240, partial [Rickettsiales bacterium]|nr:hypothetical protein [Rickettsiales bacterium]
KDILDTLTLKALEIAKTENADVFLGVGISKTQKNALSKGAIPYFFNLCSGQNIDCHVMGNAVAMDPSNEQGAVGYLVVNPLSPQARGNIYASIALEEQIAFLEISRQASQLPESKKVNDCIKDLLDFYVEIRRGAIDTTAKTLERMKQNGISANNPYIVYGSFPKAMLALEERTHSTLLSREQREELNTLNNEVLKAIENLVKRLIDEQEQKNDTRIATIRAYGESLNPGKNLHEVLEHNLMANKLNSMIPAGAAHGR